MKEEPQAVSAGPVLESARISSLDLIRGVAVLGILLMNAVHVKLGLVPYDNLSAGGSETWLDWSVGVFGEIFVDQKFMGLFSMLFGAGMLMFIERAAARGARAVLLNLWRNTLLLVIGILHVLVWMGDVLMAYAVASLFLIALRKLPGKALIGIGGVIFLLVVGIDFLLQAIANDTGDPLTGIWTQPDATPDSLLGLGILFNYFLRGLALILIGAGLYRAGFMQGTKSADTYRLTAIIGLGSGLTLAALGVILVVVNDFSTEVAIVGNMPNNLGTIPRLAGIYEPHRPLEPEQRQRTEAPASRRRPDGIDQLPDPNHPGSPGPDSTAGRGYSEPQRNSALCLGRVDSPTVVVADLARPFPLWPGRVAMAGWDLPATPAIAPGAGNLTTHLRELAPVLWLSRESSGTSSRAGGCRRRRPAGPAA